MNLTKSEKAALAKLVEYSWKDEQESYLEHNESPDHIFRALIRLRKALDRPKPAPPKVVIYVEGGCVQAVHSTQKAINISVLDCDGNNSFENSAEADKIAADPDYHQVF